MTTYYEYQWGKEQTERLNLKFFEIRDKTTCRFTQMRTTLYNLLEDAGVEMRIIGRSCCLERNQVFFSMEHLEKAIEIEKEYERILIQKFIDSLTPISGYDDRFFEKKQRLYGNGEPLVQPENIIPIYWTRYYENERTVGYLDISKVEMSRHLNIEIPHGWAKNYCIGRCGASVKMVEDQISKMAGYKIRIHYYQN